MKFVIDPGHGGLDNGASAVVPGVVEDVINLEVCRRLHERLIVAGHSVLMTRKEDVFVSLAERVQMSNEFGPDYFLSVHCNSRPQSGRYGLEAESFYYPGSVKGQTLATRLLDSMQFVWNLDGDPSIPFIYRGVKAGPFYVLRHTVAPAALVELGFLTDVEEVEELTDFVNWELFARALAEGLTAE